MLSFQDPVGSAGSQCFQASGSRSLVQVQTARESTRKPEDNTRWDGNGPGGALVRVSAVVCNCGKNGVEYKVLPWEIFYGKCYSSSAGICL